MAKAENGERKLNVLVSTGAALALARLARHHGVTQREMIESLVLDADQKIIAGLDIDAPEWVAYFGVKAL